MNRLYIMFLELDEKFKLFILIVSIFTGYFVDFSEFQNWLITEGKSRL